MTAHAFSTHPFVAGLEAAQMRRLATCASEVSFPENAFIFREGTSADTLYLLCDGSVALEQEVPGSGIVTVESLGPGDLAGLSWMFPSAHWTLDARCMTPVTAYALSASCLRECLASDQTLAVALLTRLTHALYERLTRVRLQRLDVYSQERP